MDRRSLLSMTGTTMAVVLSGCSSTTGDGTSRTSRASNTNTPSSDPNGRGTSPKSASPTDRSFSIPTASECEHASRPTPGSPDARIYPEIPETINKKEAKMFVTAFEDAFQYNRFTDTAETVQTTSTVPTWAAIRAKDGYVVGIDGVVRFSDTRATGTATPGGSGQFNYIVWYYVTNQFVLRGEPEQGTLQRGDNPQLSDAKLVICVNS